LVTKFSFRRNLALSEWKSLCGYMKKKVNDDMDNPDQLSHLISSIFEKKAVKDQQDDFGLELLQLDRYRKCFDTVEANLRRQTLSQSTQNDVLAIKNLKKRIRVVHSEYMKHQNKSKLIKVNPLFNRKEYLGKRTQPMPVERYLVEIIYPEVQIAYKNNIYTKQLDELDVEFLIRSDFQRWMLYLINSHFRAELNVGNDQPIPRL